MIWSAIEYLVRQLWTLEKLIPDILIFASQVLTLRLLSAPRYRPRTTHHIWLCALLLSSLLPAMGLLLAWSTPDFFWYISALVICGVTFLLSSDGPYLQNLFLLATYINYFAFSFAAAQGIASSFIDNDPLAVLEFRLMFLLVFAVVVDCDIRPFFTRVAKNVRRGWFSLTMLATVFSVCLVTLMLISDFFVHSDAMTVTMLGALFVIMVSAYVVIFLMIQTMNRDSQEQRLALERKLLQEQLSTYRSWSARIEQNRHDFRHHNLLILEYAKNGNCAAIIQHLQEYEAAAESTHIPRYCPNVTVNSIVTAFTRQAQEKNIRLSAEIRVGSILFVKDTHLAAILANLLENALKGSLLAKGEPWVELLILHKKHKLIIQCRNNCAEKIPFLNGVPQAVGRTGVGVTSMIDTVSLYAGNTEFFARDGVFTCRMVLNDLAAAK